MAVNPNWPTLFAEANFAVNPYYGTAAGTAYTDLTPRLYRQWSIRRGMQFELGAIQSGEFRGQWRNKDGALDPSNTGGYYSPNVVPYRGYRMRAVWAPSQNLLGGDQATGGELTPLTTGTSGNGYGVNGYFGNYTVTASGSAWQGTQVWQFTGTTGSNNSLLYLAAVPVQAVFGTPYTISVRVRSATSGANPVVQPVAVWVSSSGNPVSQTSGGTVSLTGSPTAAWTTITYTDTVPTQAFGLWPAALQFVLQIPTQPAGTWSFQADGIQVEQAATASAFSAPGASYPLFGALIERYPQSWNHNGTYGLVAPVCVDTMALLSQTILKEAFTADVANTSPAWFYPLNDPSGSTAFAEQAGRFPAAATYSSANGAGTLTAGTAITAADPVNGKFLGTNGPVVNVNNPNQNQGTVVDLTPAGIAGAPSSGGWTRMLAFRNAQTFGTPVMAAYTSGNGPGYVGFLSAWYLQLQVSSGTNMVVATRCYNDAGTTLGLAASGPVVNDNNWHLVFFQMSADGKTLTLVVDGVTSTTTGGVDMHAALAANDAVGGDEYKLSSTIGFGGSNWIGDLALYAQWNSLLTPLAMSNLYTSFKTAWQGERSDQRYSRILGWAGYQGTASLDQGATVSMGPANDISNLDALTALQNVVNTEGGRHFVSASGAVTFGSRATWFKNTSPLWTFGENAGGGEIPYVGLTFDFDTTRISNTVAVTQTTTNQNFNAADTASQQNYGTRNLARTSQSTDPVEVQQSAYFLLSRYKNPQMRVAALRVDPAANPALFPSVLAFELGQRIRINRRDQFGVRPTITMDGFIEQITHNGDDAGSWTTDLQVSPAPATAYGVFTDLRTTLKNSASSGASTITINPLADSAVNNVRANLSDGQSLQIGLGATYEIAVIATGGVSNSGPGYTSATITLVNPLAFNHSAGESVTESPAQNYDANAHFDSALFCY